MIRTATGEAPVALVTGGGRGIGRAIARDLAGAGCRVAVAYDSGRISATELCSEIVAAGGRSIPVRGDVSRSGDIRAILDTVTDRLGPIDILVNNAGVAPRETDFDRDEQHFDRVMVTNARSAYLLTQGVVDGMKERRWGRLIFVSSLAARAGGQISAPYAASEAAMEGMMHFYAHHLRPHGITSNAVAPAAIRTDLFNDIPAPPAAALPFGRFGQPEEVATMVTALVATGYVTGQTVQINGGLVHS